MIKIIYERNGVEYDHLEFKVKELASRMIMALESRGCIIKEIIDDKSEGNEEVDRKSRGIS